MPAKEMSMTTNKRLENLIKEAHEVVRYTTSKDVKFFAEAVISYFEDLEMGGY
jgi:hypothetical protein